MNQMDVITCSGVDVAVAIIRSAVREFNMLEFFWQVAGHCLSLKATTAKYVWRRIVLNRSVFSLDMRCFQTEADVVVSVALANMAIAAWAALMPQYAFISWTAGALYYHVAVRWLEPLCEWRKYYYAVFAAGGVASIATYIYALDAAVKYAELGDRIIFGREVSPGEYVVWMAIQ